MILNLQGDVIGALLDRSNATIRFFKNGQDLGVAFRNVAEQRLFPVRPWAADDLWRQAAHCNASMCCAARNSVARRPLRMPQIEIHNRLSVQSRK